MSQVRAILLAKVAGTALGEILEVTRTLGIHPLSLLLFDLLDWPNLGQDAQASAKAAVELQWVWESLEYEREPIPIPIWDAAVPWRSGSGFGSVGRLA